MKIFEAQLELTMHDPSESSKKEARHFNQVAALDFLPAGVLLVVTVLVCAQKGSGALAQGIISLAFEDFV